MRKLGCILFCFLLAQSGSLFGQVALPPNTCALPTSLKSCTLGYKFSPNTTPNFRFFYKVIVQSGTTPTPDQLYIVNPSNPNNNTSSYDWDLDSTRKVTGVIDPCIVLPSPPNYTVYYYHADVFLNNNNTGYMASAVNCCRPANALDMTFPFNNTGYLNPPPPGYPPCPDAGPGEVYNAIASFVRIPPLNSITGNFKNSTPSFTTIDTILNVCNSRSFSYSLNATDADGDSLAYHFSAASTYELDAINEHTFINRFIFSPVLYRSPYTAQQPAGPNVSLDPVSGLLHGTISDTGLFVLTVTVPEYRGGQVIDSISQDLFVHVYNCDSLPKPKASIPSLNSCNDLTLNFPNNSVPLYPGYNWNNTTFQWDFGDGGASNQVFPVHTYADTGAYNVRLIIFPGLYCADTAYSKALVYPYLTPDFTYNDTCSNQPVAFINTSTYTGGVINSASWQFKKDTTLLGASNDYNASFTFTKAPQTYDVLLTVGTDKGCMATDTQHINIWQSPYPLASHDTILSKGATLQLMANDGVRGNNAEFNWSPPLGLSSTTIADPILTSTTDTIYYVTIKNYYGCTLTDSIRVKYYVGPQIYVPNAFTPNGDGKNDVLRPVPVGMLILKYFRVFSRYGQLMYETEKPFAGWDGTFHGSQAPAGTYVWEAAGIDYNHKSFAINGTFILIR